jgi:hypothetical protein
MNKNSPADFTNSIDDSQNFYGMGAALPSSGYTVSEAEADKITAITKPMVEKQIATIQKVLDLLGIKVPSTLIASTFLTIGGLFVLYSTKKHAKWIGLGVAGLYAANKMKGEGVSVPTKPSSPTLTSNGLVSTRPELIDLSTGYQK